MTQARRGMVYLVGAGPGDPGLITVRGLALLRSAEVVVHDRLIDPSLLNEAARDAEIIDVGKSPGDHRARQENIQALLIDRARAGRVVVRLKGGDPFVFGRGFEELAACREVGVDCVVIPGVSSALAAPLAAGIPITSRRLVRSFAVVTGSIASDSQVPAVDYPALARIDAVVILMGREPLRNMARSLIDAGRDPATPVACIQGATTPRQRVVRATLATIADVADEQRIVAPVVTVIGAVAGLAETASTHAAGWTRRLGAATGDSDSPAPEALAGRRIVITRPRSRTKETLRALARAGAVAVSLPLTRFVSAEDSDPIARAIARLVDYDWIAFTSPVAVRFFRRALDASGLDMRALSGIRVAAVGATTARTLSRRGITPDRIADGSGADALVDAIRAADAGDAPRILFPRGNIARTTLPDRLRGAGYVVDDMIVYRTLPVAPSAAHQCELCGDVDAVLFFSPSAVKRFAELGSSVGAGIVACIGPSTAEAARESGLSVAVVAREHTARGLLTALAAHWRSAGVTE